MFLRMFLNTNLLNQSILQQTMWFMKKSYTKKVKIDGKEVDIHIIYNAGKIKSYTTSFKKNLYHEPQTKVYAEKIHPDFILDFLGALTEKVLEDDPSLIVTDPFAINLGLRKLDSHIAGRYHGDISSLPCAFITLNSRSFEMDFFAMMEHIRSNPDKFNTFRSESNFADHLGDTIRHELRHHLEKARFIADGRAQEKYRSTLMTRLYNISYLATAVRREAVTTFESKIDERYPLNALELRRLMEVFTTISLINIDTYLKYCYQHNMAMLMSYIIALNYLKSKKDVEFAQWANKAAKKINKYLSKDRGIYLEPFPEKDIQMVVDHIKEMSVEEYFQEYEKACKKLGISGKNRFLTWRNYKKAMKWAYDIDMMFARRRGFLPNLVKGIVKKYFFG
jgi:hypothetical protein